MNQWSRTRKRIILSIVLLAAAVLLGGPLFLLFYQAPACSDGKQNGDETGVDCGGSCQRLCAPESLPLVIEGDPRVLTVASSTYEVVAVFENPNTDAEIKRARYTFKLFGSANLIPIKTILGETYIPKGARFAIFEGPFTIEGGAVPSRATLEWEGSSFIWEKNARPIPELAIAETELLRTESSPRLEAVVENRSLESVANIDLVALISDESGNIFAASKTFIDALSPGSEAQAIFTWPRPFSGRPVEIEIITRIFPDRSYIR